MASDSSYGAPQAKGSGLTSRPWLLWGGVGVGAIVLFLYLRNRSAANSANSAITNPNVAPVVDPNTGQVLDPLTGLPYLTSQASSASSTQTMSGWLAAAEAALANAGYSPALVEQALYDFSNGNTLTNQESGVINRALGLVGSPPNLLPFLGTVPNPQPPAKPPTVTLPGRTVGGTNPAKPYLPIAKLPASLLAKMLPGEHIVSQTETNPATGAGYYLTNLGGVFAVGGDQSYGSFLGLPAKTRAGITNFVQLIVNPKGGYTEVTAQGQRYTFSPTTLKQGVGVGQGK